MDRMGGVINVPFEEDARDLDAEAAFALARCGDDGDFCGLSGCPTCQKYNTFNL